MRASLYQSDLDFIEECKIVFENDYRRFTHINKDDDRIALRYGMYHDCIKLFELGEEKAFFHNIINVCPVETIKSDENKKGKLYVVDYSYEDDKKEVVKDRWVVACKNSEAVRKLMELNSRAFELSGYSIMGYSFSAVSDVVDGYEITVRKKD